MSETVNILNQTYARTGQSKKNNELGMREMQAFTDNVVMTLQSYMT